MSVAVMTDSGSGISPEESRELGIQVIPMPFQMGDVLYREDVTITRDEFFRKLAAGETVSTSQPSPSTLTTAWNAALKDHDEVLYIPLTSGLSSTYENAHMLSQDEHFGGRVHVCDARGVSAVLSMICEDAIRLADDGRSAAQIARTIEGNAGRNSIYIFMDTLEYLRRGGRITRPAAAFASFLHIKPILKIENGSHLDIFSKGRTGHKCREAMIRQLHVDLETKFRDPDAKHCHLGVAYSSSLEDAKNFEKEIADSFPNRKYRDLVVKPLSLMICCHIGPGALGCGFYCPVED